MATPSWLGRPPGCRISPPSVRLLASVRIFGRQYTRRPSCQWSLREKSLREKSYCYGSYYIRPKITQPNHSIQSYDFYALCLRRAIRTNFKTYFLFLELFSSGLFSLGLLSWHPVYVLKTLWDKSRHCYFIKLKKWRTKTVDLTVHTCIRGVLNSLSLKDNPFCFQAPSSA